MNFAAAPAGLLAALALLPIGSARASGADLPALAPYQMVKDLRTEYEVNNPSNVFDGDLDGFINAGIRWRKQAVQP